MLPWSQNDTLSETNPRTKITPSRAAHPVTQYMGVPPGLEISGKILDRRRHGPMKSVWLVN